MYKLLARPGSGSTAIEAMLAELGVPHEVIIVKRDAQNRLPEMVTRLNPMAQVPTLVLPSGEVLTESAAMMIYLADMHAEKGLAPGLQDALRPRYLRWMIFLSAAVYDSDLRMYYPQRYSTEAAAAPGIKEKAIADITREFAILAEALGEGPYFLGGRFSALDIYAAMLITWAPDLDAQWAAHPNLKALHDRVARRPAIAPVWARNDYPAG
jgi:glutathione S-transferase/GST-like protein